MTPRPAGHADRHNRGVRTLLLLAVGVVAVSLSGPLMAAAVVPPLAIAFWRNALGTAAIAPAAVTRQRAELRSLTGRRLGLVLASGAVLAVHFATWVTSLTLTSVASATAIVCLQLAWVVCWQLLRGERFGARVVAGLALAFAGVLVVSGVDLTLSTRAVAGDGLALIGGMAAAAYTVIGSRARQSASTTTYTFVCYGSCAVLLALACLVAGQRLGGYPAGQWALLLLITATAQLLGHSVFNHLLATTGPLLVSLALLLEVPGAALLAAVIVHQKPPVTALAGLAVMVAGMALVVAGRRTSRAVPAVEAPVD
ncbi:drug/metabolite transporter (DMT)-like permease [Oryzihumus leptocrescens]|uniref:Drug/metabolite transporter (DMT)-like permease n=1 Tax=Oryzihumus leptocrescens TaxID=297536 RepID=A0A542Z908_9MICO|nr:drug/metabolite transporter (DMT)-like permease [Oryzihumus leptocrescens]